VTAPIIALPPAIIIAVRGLVRTKQADYLWTRDDAEPVAAMIVDSMAWPSVVLPIRSGSIRWQGAQLTRPDVFEDACELLMFRTMMSGSLPLHQPPDFIRSIANAGRLRRPDAA
jgi:hypothetical protein